MLEFFGTTETIEQDPLTSSTIGAVIEVHRGLGPGLLETQVATYNQGATSLGGASAPPKIVPPGI